MLKTEPSAAAGAHTADISSPATWFSPALFILGPVGASFGAWAILGGLDLLGYAGWSWEKLAGFPEPRRDLLSTFHSARFLSRGWA